MYNKLLILLPFFLSTIVQWIIPSDFSQNKKVFFQPPGYMFGIVWTVLYLMLGVYLHNILTRDNYKFKNTLLVLFCINLTINLLWTPVVNNLRWYKTGIYMIAILLCLTFLKLIMDEKRLNKVLLVPYFSWLSFALLLNIELARLYNVSS